MSYIGFSNSNKTDISNLDSVVTDLSGVVNTNKTDISNLDGVVTDLSGVVNTNKTDISNLELSANVFDTSINDLYTNVNNAKEDISNIDSKTNFFTSSNINIEQTGLLDIGQQGSRCDYASNYYGNIIAVSSYSNGRVDIYKYNNIDNSWNKYGNSIYGDRLGRSISLNKEGDILVVGSDIDYNYDLGLNHSVVKVFKYNEIDNSWNQLGNTLFGTIANINYFGYDVDINSVGNIIIVGETGYRPSGTEGADYNYGAVYCYKYNEVDNSWNQLGNTFYGDISKNEFGANVRINDTGNIIAMSTKGSSSINGYIKVYEFDEVDNSWNQLGDTFYGTDGNGLGWSIDINSVGDIISFGISSYPDNLWYGLVKSYKYNRYTNTWNKLGNDFTHIHGNTEESFGTLIELNSEGNIMAIYAPGYNNYNDGIVYIYTFNGINWEYRTHINKSNPNGSQIGYPLCLSKNAKTLIIGYEYDSTDIEIYNLNLNTSLTSTLNVNYQNIENVNDPINNNDAANKKYVDAQITDLSSAKFDKTGGSITGDISTNSDIIMNNSSETNTTLNYSNTGEFTIVSNSNEILKSQTNKLLLGAGIDDVDIKGAHFQYLPDGFVYASHDMSMVTNISVKSKKHHTMVLDSEGNVYATGKNHVGQLGLGDDISRNKLTKLDISNVSAIEVDNSNSLFLMNDGTVKICGNYNSTNYTTPTTIADLSNVIQINSNYSSFALLNNGTVMGWGNNDYNQIDNTDVNSISTPTIVPDLSNVIQISSGQYHTAFLLNNGNVIVIGDNTYGQCGNNNGLIDLSLNIKQVSCGPNHTLFLLEDGSVKGIGDNSGGILGNPYETDASYNTPIDVYGSKNVVSIDCGDNHNVLLLDDDSVQTFGQNNFGQLGIEYNNPSFSRQLKTIIDGSNINASIVCAGLNTTIIYTDASGLIGYGVNSNGQLGDGTTTNANLGIATEMLQSAYTYSDITTISGESGSDFGYSIDISPDGSFVVVGSPKYTKQLETPQLETITFDGNNYDNIITPYAIIPEGDTFSLDGNLYTCVSGELYYDTNGLIIRTYNSNTAKLTITNDVSINWESITMTTYYTNNTVKIYIDNSLVNTENGSFTNSNTNLSSYSGNLTIEIISDDPQNTYTEFNINTLEYTISEILNSGKIEIYKQPNWEKVYTYEGSTQEAYSNFGKAVSINSNYDIIILSDKINPVILVSNNDDFNSPPSPSTITDIDVANDTPLACKINESLLFISTISSLKVYDKQQMSWVQSANSTNTTGFEYIYSIDIITQYSDSNVLFVSLGNLNQHLIKQFYFYGSPQFTDISTITVTGNTDYKTISKLIKNEKNASFDIDPVTITSSDIDTFDISNGFISIQTDDSSNTYNSNSVNDICYNSTTNEFIFKTTNDDLVGQTTRNLIISPTYGRQFIDISLSIDLEITDSNFAGFKIMSFPRIEEYNEFKDGIGSPIDSSYVSGSDIPGVVPFGFVSNTPFEIMVIQHQIDNNSTGVQSLTSKIRLDTVTIDDNTLIVGDFNSDSNNGKVDIYSISNPINDRINFEKIQTIYGTDIDSNPNRFGMSIAANKDISTNKTLLSIGSPYMKTNGITYIYEYNTTTDLFEYNNTLIEGTSSLFAGSQALSQTSTLAVGTYTDGSDNINIIDLNSSLVEVDVDVMSPDISYSTNLYQVPSQHTYIGVNTTDPFGSLHVRNDFEFDDETNIPYQNSHLLMENSGNLWHFSIHNHDTNENHLHLAFNKVTRGYFKSDNDAKVLDFTGQHRNILLENDTTILSTMNKLNGFIVSSTSKFYETVTINNALPFVELSKKQKDKSVFGVISDCEDENENTRKYEQGSFVTVINKETSNDTRAIINSVGEGGMWVCNINGNIENGDYITSSHLPGLGMKQNEEYLANYTVSKATQDIDFSEAKQLITFKELTTERNVNGEYEYKTKTDSEGNIILREKYESKYVEVFSDKYVIYNDTEKTDEYYTYMFDFANGTTEQQSCIGNTYTMAFIGCTYHCG